MKYAEDDDVIENVLGNGTENGCFNAEIPIGCVVFTRNYSHVL